MKHLLLYQCIQRKVLDHIAMFADQGPTIIFGSCHSDVSAVKNAFKLEVGRRGMVSKVAPEGEDARKNAKGCLDYIAQEEVRIFLKDFLGAHLLLPKKAA
jgi:hypothetical protein